VEGPLPTYLIQLSVVLWLLRDTALTQPSSLSANMGDTIRITCSGINSWSSQKVPGTAPVTLIYGSSSRPSDIPSRFSGSASGSLAMLTISGLQAEDKAVCFCGSRNSNGAGVDTQIFK
uniref:Immunoglobulin V-set domain-containing protein n=1 Tax=Zosterops lateralis melanops TaxID=1220523 RepID=A0A8D2QR63_ZOSLA